MHSEMEAICSTSQGPKLVRHLEKDVVSKLEIEDPVLRGLSVEDPVLKHHFEAYPPEIKEGKQEIPDSARELSVSPVASMGEAIPILGGEVPGTYQRRGSGSGASRSRPGESSWGGWGPPPAKSNFTPGGTLPTSQIMKKTNEEVGPSKSWSQGLPGLGGGTVSIGGKGQMDGDQNEEILATIELLQAQIGVKLKELREDEQSRRGRGYIEGGGTLLRAQLMRELQVLQGKLSLSESHIESTLEPDKEEWENGLLSLHMEKKKGPKLPAVGSDGNRFVPKAKRAGEASGYVYGGGKFSGERPYSEMIMRGEMKKKTNPSQGLTAADLLNGTFSL